MENPFSYYELQLKLTSEMLGTATEGSIYDQHVLQKAKKLIKEANKLGAKVTKSLAKYQGEEISEKKELLELQSVIHAYENIMGKRYELPETADGVLELFKEIETEFGEMVEAGEQTKATIFLRNKDGKPCISSHMILGEVKEVLKTVTNGGNKTIFKSKVAVSEGMALDLKVVEPLLIASQDIMRKEDGSRLLNERPIRFTTPMGVTQTAIAQSEQLPIGTEFKATLRIRKGSPLDTQDILEFLFSHGKNLGLGSWRGSGGKGAFVFKLKALPDFKEEFEDGWM